MLILISLSRDNYLLGLLIMSLVKQVGMLFAKKWIGGVTIQDVISEAKKTNGYGENVIINYLGEDYSDKTKIKQSVATYAKLLSQMKNDAVKGDIAIKPTQLGLSISYDLFLSNYRKVVELADKDHRFVWMDMEDHMFVDDSVMAYLTLLKKHKNVGICIQTKLMRSLWDIKRIAKAGGVIRLVKGAYPARKGISYFDKAEVDRNYIKCMEYLFNNSKRFMLATHDDKMVDIALKLQKKSRAVVLFGMLKGIRGRLARKLTVDGEKMYVYIPFGPEWLEYSVRRLKELEHSTLIIRSIISD